MLGAGHVSCLKSGRKSESKLPNAMSVHEAVSNPKISAKKIRATTFTSNLAKLPRGNPPNQADVASHPIAAKRLREMFTR